MRPTFEPYSETRGDHQSPLVGVSEWQTDQDWNGEAGSIWREEDTPERQGRWLDAAERREIAEFIRRATL